MKNILNDIAVSKLIKVGTSPYNLIVKASWVFKYLNIF